MRAEYDFSKMKGRRNPYATRLKKPVTMRLGSEVVEYFKGMAGEMDVPELHHEGFSGMRLLFLERHSHC